jgi:hypothetical protein
LCCPVVLLYLYVLSFLLWCPLRLPHNNDVRYVFIYSCWWYCSCLIYDMCVCMRIVVPKTYCDVFCFICLCLVYHMLPFSLDCPYVIAPSIIFDLY